MMKGPFFIKDKDSNYIPADICKNCAFFGEGHQDCVMQKCPFIPDYSEDEDEKETK